MPGQVRAYDFTIGMGNHNQPGCPHSILGVWINGSPNVLTNSRPSVRTLDFTVHFCPHCGVGMAVGGSTNVLSNSKGNHRVGDSVTEFCGVGITVIGSTNVFVNGL